MQGKLRGDRLNCLSPSMSRKGNNKKGDYDEKDTFEGFGRKNNEEGVVRLGPTPSLLRPCGRQGRKRRNKPLPGLQLFRVGPEPERQPALWRPDQLQLQQGFRTGRHL